MGGKHNKCCCTAATAGDLYVVHQYQAVPFPPTITGRIWHYDGETGTGSLFYSTTLETVAIACSRDGHVYTIDGTTLRKIDSTGTLVWSITTTGITNPRGVAVGQGGYVYVCGLTSSGLDSMAKRYRTSDGVAVDTGGGNGYGTTFSGATFNGLCVAQDERVWICGVQATYARIYSINAAGKYGTVYSYTTLGTNKSLTTINIDEANTTLVAGGSFLLTVDASSITSFTSVSFGTYGTAYSPNGNQYAGGGPSSGYGVLENGANFFTSNRVAAVVCGGDNSVFIGRPRPAGSPNYSVLRIGYWGVDAGSQYTPLCCDIATGRIGAFGNV